MNEQGEILFQNIYHLVTMNDRGERLSGVDLLIQGNKIAKIGKDIDAPGAKLINASTSLVIPGLINTHHHLYQTLQRNIPAVQDAELFDWLKILYRVWQHLTPEAVRVSTLLGCGELLKTGCTTALDQYYVFPVGIDEDLIGIQVEAAREVGIRFHPTRGSMSRGESQGGLPPDSVVQDEETILKDCQRVIERHHDPAPFAMTQVAIAPCSPFSVSKDLLRRTVQLAREMGVLCHTHVAETEDENQYCLEVYGKRPLALMEEMGWLGEDISFAHGIHFRDEELDLLAQTKTAIAHCPTSNMRLGSGVARVPEMIRRGITVGLAVDGSASNDSSDMLGEMRNCLLMHRLNWGASAMTAQGALSLATRGGAKLLRRKEIGSLEVGKAADLAMIDLNRLEYTGSLSDPLAAVIFSGIDHTVNLTMVNGWIVVRDGQLLGVDETKLIEDGNRLSNEMLEKAGI
ncbi:MAG: hydroxydechloroatrazine ethylaminohydrolase [candidate division Zixibacteria bacterium SM23_81]|nr:MAG: hydroxydechloroatrazine ethylaminohydrolase [candidate division Zixibacteria bacterium SM23_81]